MTWYEHLSPFGAHFSAPVFFVRNVQIQQIKTLKGGHFRLTLAEGKESRVALWFSPAKDHPLVQKTFSEGLRVDTMVDALVEPQWNYYSGRRTLQLLVQDLRPAT